MQWIARRIVPCLLLLLPLGARAQSDSTTAFPANASLPYPPSLQDDASTMRHETSVRDRQQRFEPSTTRQVAMLPVRLLQLPFWLLNYPLEHWLVRRHPPAFVQRRLYKAQQLLQSGYGFRYGGFGVGSGIGGGVSYRGLVPGTARTYAKTFVGATLTGYQQYYLQFDRRFGTRTIVNSRIQFRDQPRIEFYGVGLHSDPSRESSYRILSTSASLSGQTGFARHSFFGWTLGLQHQDPRRGLTPGIPSTTEIFSPSAANGLDGDTDLLKFGLSLGLDGRDNPAYAHRGTFALASVVLNDGLGENSALVYTQYGVELQQFVALPGVRRTLAMRLHGLVTDNQSSDGRGIPTWSLQQLGGGHSLRSLPNFRYADEDLLVANLEYRFPFWFLEHQSGVAIDALTFFDVGTVLPSLDKLQQRDLRSGAGFGFRLVTKHNALFKLDVGWTSQHFKLDAGVRGPL